MNQGETMTTADFEMLFKTNYERLYYHAYDFVHDEDAAKDVVSDVFVNVWRLRDRVEVNTSLSYLYAAVRNRCLDQLKATNRNLSLLEDVIADFEQYTDEDWEEHERRIAALKAELSRLPERTRRVLQLRFYEHKSNQEVADQLGITIDGVKKIIQRAFAQLRLLLGKKMLNSVLLFILSSIKW